MKKKQINLANYRTVAKFYNEWIASEQIAKSEHTIDGYKRALKLFLKEFLEGKYQLANSRFDINKALSTASIKAWMLWLRDERHCKAQTINHRFASLLRYLEYLGKQEPSMMTYYLEAKAIQKHREKPTKVNGFEMDALTALLNAPNPKTKTGYRDCVMLSLLYATGARIGELLSVKIADIKISKDEKKVSEITFFGKGNKYRCIPLLRPTVEQLIAYINRFHEGGKDSGAYLFYSKSRGKHTPLTTRAVAYQLRKYAHIAHEKCDSVPLDAHCHQFRHTRATEWIREKHALPTVSSLLGHASIETTMTYLDITPEMIAEATKTVASDEANALTANWSSDVDFSGLFNF